MSGPKYDPDRRAMLEEDPFSFDRDADAAINACAQANSRSDNNGPLAQPAPEASSDPAHPGAIDLGATLYVPITHAAVGGIVAGEKLPMLRSVVLCLEDALHVDNVPRGLSTLRLLLADLATARETLDPAAAVHARFRETGAPIDTAARRGPLVFVRPRNVDMALRIAEMPGARHLDGFVAPKILIEDLAAWWRVVEAIGVRVMPTLERPWFFDPIAVSEFADALAALDRRRLMALRVGGNDLLGLLGLRRQRGRTIYEGPLLAGLSQVMGQLGSRGFPLTAPVFDILDDPATLDAEAHRDVAFGFVGKTAIHPGQIPVIERAFSVSWQDLGQAQEILSADAGAVFRQGGAMAEPATHRAWAARIIARSRSYGVLGPLAAV